MRTTDHVAHFRARARSAELPPVGPHAELVRDLEAQLALRTDPTIRACIEKLLESARRAIRLPAPPRVPTCTELHEMGIADLGVERDHRARTEGATVRPGAAA